MSSSLTTNNNRKRKNVLANSNRKANIVKPERLAKSEDFDKKEIKKNIVNDPISSVTFATNLKIDNHIRDELQTMVALGFAPSQKEAVKIAISSYKETLTSDQLEAFENQNNTFEKRDVKNYQNKNR